MWESPADDISGKHEAEEDWEGLELLTHPADLLSGLGGGPQWGAGSFRGADTGVAHSKVQGQGIADTGNSWALPRSGIGSLRPPYILVTVRPHCETTPSHCRIDAKLIS